MKFQVGKFTCELSLDDRGDVRAQWLPRRPRYLNREERAQYLARRSAFLEVAHAEAAVNGEDAAGARRDR
jgi:hypothetical protein